MANNEEQRLSVLSGLLNRVQAISSLFRRFNDRRRYDQEFGYIEQLTQEHYRAAYERYSIAQRIVRLPAEDTWKVPPLVYEDEDPSIETEFETAWRLLVKRLRLWHYLERADVVAGLGRYAILLVDVAGRQDLRSEIKKGAISGLSVFAEDHAKIKEWVTDQGDRRFNMPKLYEITWGSATDSVGYATRSGVSAVVHYSRVIHFADGLLEDDVYGMPRLATVFNRLDDLEKVLGGAAESFFQRARNALAFITDKDFRPAKAEAAMTAMKDQIEEMEHRIRTHLELWGTDVKNLTPEIADPSGVLRGLFSVIAGSRAIPQRLLFGSERGDLASQQDRSNWSDRVAVRQTKIGEPVLSDFIDRAVKIGELPAPKEFTVWWPPAQVLTDLERAEIVQRRASATKSFAQQGTEQFPGVVVTVDEAREELGYPALKAARGEAALKVMQKAIRLGRQDFADRVADALMSKAV